MSTFNYNTNTEHLVVRGHVTKFADPSPSIAVYVDIRHTVESEEAGTAFSILTKEGIRHDTMDREHELKVSLADVDVGYEVLGALVDVLQAARIFIKLTGVDNDN